MATKRTAKKRSTIARRGGRVPENIYKVVPKRLIDRTKKKKVAQKRHVSVRTRLHQTIPRPVLILVGLLLICTVLFTTWYANNVLTRSIKDTNETIAAGAYTKDTVQRMRLIGKPDTYPAEIANYQSAPEDLQPFILDDYKMLKTQCIVNGGFAGPVSYAIVNVVYDSFARIEKNCNGADTLLLKKMSGTWTVIYSGNDLPKCSDVNAFGIPQGISYNCRDGFVTYTNPNP